MYCTWCYGQLQNIIHTDEAFLNCHIKREIRKVLCDLCKTWKSLLISLYINPYTRSVMTHSIMSSCMTSFIPMWPSEMVCLTWLAHSTMQCMCKVEMHCVMRCTLTILDQLQHSCKCLTLITCLLYLAEKKIMLIFTQPIIRLFIVFTWQAFGIITHFNIIQPTPLSTKQRHQDKLRHLFLKKWPNGQVDSYSMWNLYKGGLP